jgi:hypothetical protein
MVSSSLPNLPDRHALRQKVITTLDGHNHSRFLALQE